MQYTLKKSLGQHFLNDAQVCKDIQAVLLEQPIKQLLEVGPGAGALTKYIQDIPTESFKAIELDREKVAFLSTEYPELKDKLILADILDAALPFENEFVVAGNFPYNISTQIVFKILEWKEHVPMMVGMFQKEVAERIAAPPKNKTYGILSVFLQAFYTIEYLFTVHEDVFTPPPRVKSAVIRCTRNNTMELGCNEILFVKVVKAGFNQRRKTLRNSLKPYIHDKPEISSHPFFTKRAEELSVEDFVELTNLVEKKAL